MSLQVEHRVKPKKPKEATREKKNVNRKWHWSEFYFVHLRKLFVKCNMKSHLTDWQRKNKTGRGSLIPFYNFRH